MSPYSAQQNTSPIVPVAPSRRRRPSPEGAQRRGPTLLNAFIEKDYVRFQEEVKKVVQSHWSEKALPKTRRTAAEPVLSETEASTDVNIMQKPSHFRWPYVEAAFAKLAVMDGAAMIVDDFWFPLAFIEKF
jgi:hypothetical protein